LTQLETLSIKDNENLTTIPDDIKTLPNLKSEIKLSSNILLGENVKSRFIDGSMSRQGYTFDGGANKIFEDKQQFKYTYAQGDSESEALKIAQQTLKIAEGEQVFVMKKELKNGKFSLVVFAKAKENEYYKR
jgi:hypothetical protein